MNCKETHQENEKEKRENKYTISKLKVSESGVTVILENEKIQISDDAYFKYGLNNLKEVDKDLYLKLKNDERLHKAYKGCLRKISTKDHTVRQITDFLSKYQLNESEIDAMIQKLKGYGFLDDEKFCIGKISFFSSTNASYRKIRQKLMESGISEQLISKYLIEDEQEEYRKAREVAEKFAQNIKNRSVKMKKQIIQNRLAGLGFTYGAVSEALQCIEIHTENELELLRRDYRKVRLKYEKKYEDMQLKSHIIAALLQKGFSYDDVKTVLEEENGQEG